MITVEVISDVACPFCFIGKRRLEGALRTLEPGSVAVRWQPFELQPDLPSTGAPADEFYRAKFGSLDYRDAMFGDLRLMGEEVGIAFAFDAMRRAPNTRLAHRLIALAGEQGREDAAVEALFRGHFEQGADVGDLDEALALLAGAGVLLDRAAVLAGAGEEAVREGLEFARRLRVTSVPFFVADRQIALSGALPESAFVRLLETARERVAA